VVGDFRKEVNTFRAALKIGKLYTQVSIENNWVKYKVVDNVKLIELGDKK